MVLTVCIIDENNEVYHWWDHRKSSPISLSPLDVLLTKDPNQLSLLQVFNDQMKIQKASITLPHLNTYIKTALPIFLSFYLLLRLHSSSFSSSAFNCEWFFIFYSLIKFCIVIIALKAFFSSLLFLSHTTMKIRDGVILILRPLTLDLDHLLFSAAYKYTSGLPSTKVTTVIRFSPLSISSCSSSYPYPFRFWKSILLNTPTFHPKLFLVLSNLVLLL